MDPPRKAASALPCRPWCGLVAPLWRWPPVGCAKHRSAPAASKTNAGGHGGVRWPSSGKSREGLTGSGDLLWPSFVVSLWVFLGMESGPFARPRRLAGGVAARRCERSIILML